MRRALCSVLAIQQRTSAYASHAARESRMQLHFELRAKRDISIRQHADVSIRQHAYVSIRESRMQPRFELRAKLHSKEPTGGQFKHMLLKRQERGLRVV